jgi:hypothetical protein
VRGGRVPLTDSHGLDTDTLLKVSIGSIIGILALQNLLAAESVDECCAACGKEIRLVPGSRVIRFRHTCSTGAAHHQTELDSLLDILLATNLDLPGTSTGMQLAWETF